MSDKIVLLEFNDEVESFLDYCQKNNMDYKSFKIIALRPKVQVYLKRKNIKYENTLKYFDNESHERCLLKSEELYQLMNDSLQLQDATTVREGYNNFVLFRMRHYIHHLLYIIEILFQISEKNKINEIYCCIPKTNFKGTKGFITDSERYLGILAKKFAEQNGIVFKEITGPLFRESPESKYNAMFGKSLLRIIDKFRFKGLNKKDIILLTATGYNINLLSQAIKKELNNVFPININIMVSKNLIRQYFYNFFISILNKKYVSYVFLSLYYPGAKKIKDRKDVLIKEFNEFQQKLDGNLKTHFAFHNVPFSSYLFEKLNYGILPGLIDMQAQTFAVNRLLDKLKPKLLISNVSRDIFRNIAELTNEKGIPSICIPHGSLVPPKNELEKIDHYHIGLSHILNSYNYHCIQTPLAKEYIKHYPIKGETIETGNLLFSKTQNQYRDKIRQDLLGDDHQKYKIIVQGNTLKPRGSEHFHWVETFDEYTSGLIDLINAIDKIEAVHLIIKLHPAIEISENDLKLLLPKSNKYTIYKNMPFYQVLSAGDIFISFGSTAIEDALQNRIPVLLYDKWGRYKHCEALDINDISISKKSWIYYINRQEDLQKGLTYMLKDLKIKEIPNSELMKYTYLDNNKNKNFYKLLQELLKDKSENKI